MGLKLLCIFASIVWGSNVVLMKSLLAGCSPFILAFWKVTLSAAFLWSVLKYTRHSVHLPRIYFSSLFVLSLFNITLNFSLSFAGMALIQGTDTAFFNALSPLLMMMCIWLFDHHCPNKQQWMGIVLTLAGILASLHFRLDQLTWGHFLFALSLLCYGGSFLYARKISLDPIEKTYHCLWLGSLCLGAINIWRQELSIPPFQALQWFWFILLSVIGFAFIQWVYFVAAKKIGMMKTSFYMNLNPLFTYLGSVFFLKEPWDLFQLAGFILLLLGLVVSNRKNPLDKAKKIC